MSHTVRLKYRAPDVSLPICKVSIFIRTRQAIRTHYDYATKSCKPHTRHQVQHEQKDNAKISIHNFKSLFCYSFS